MEWAPKYAPPWSCFYPVGHSVAARSTVVIPFVGYLIIFNGYVVQYLNLAAALGVPTPPSQVSMRLMLIYFGLLLVAAAMAVYTWLCPNEPKYYASAHAYVGGVQGSVNKYSISRIENEVANADEEFARRFWQMRDGGRGIELEAEKQAGRNGILHVYYELKDYSHPTARRCAATLYAIGFLVLLLPSADVLGRVAWLFLKTLTARIGI
jgi:hypothetical protein